MAHHETPAYKVLEKDGAFEIRSYEDYFTAAVDEVSMTDTNGFGQIFEYISGSNSKKEKIDMTVPVINELENGSVTTEFVMPHHFTRESLPDPDNSRIKIKTREDRLCAVISFSGSISSEKIDKHLEKLQKWLVDKDIKTIGGFRLARYNPPFTPPTFRRNEILVDIQNID
ncbi:SOUL family heme-binding protein [Acetobacterium bakii]|uniref:SOUL heme-binding protein n=1 Tax=Acetobacterium bakii TaxID=52689 RepID=A0A0L6TZT8_9FIRM|nr:heme-binding protein [Acetobacterium bakii]KNZ41597.1 hypothetical protein AKG39_11470 [Acetobacterium bakii]